MTQQANPEPKPAKRRRNPGNYSKPYPTLKFEAALLLPRGIAGHSLDGEIRRLTLFQELDRSADSGPSRTLVTSAEKYGLTAQKWPGDFLTLTNNGRAPLAAEGESQAALAMRFRLAIAQFEPFRAAYEKLKGQPLPKRAALKDELVAAGVAAADRNKATAVFAANLRFLGLIRKTAGTDYIKDIAEILANLPPSSVRGVPESPVGESPAAAVSPVQESGKAAIAPKRPALHIDIQVHIDPNASAEQIDQIFASMARHLYGNES